MSHAVSQGEWKLISRSFEGRLEWERERQGKLLRLCLAVFKNDMDRVRTLMNEDGLVMDMSLVDDLSQGGSVTSQRFIDDLGVAASITPLGVAASQNQVAMLNLLLQEGQASPGQLFGRGRDAAWIAMERGSWDAYLILMGRGAIVDLRLPETRETRLINAVIRSDLPSVRDLLARRADVRLYDRDGRTALHHNFAKEPYEDVDVQIGRMLIEYGGDPNAIDKKGIPAHAFAEGYEKEALLQKHRLTQIAEEATREIERERQMAIEAELEEDITPTRPEDPTDPGTPQIHRMQKKVKLKPMRLAESQEAIEGPDMDEPAPPPSAPSPPRARRL